MTHPRWLSRILPPPNNAALPEQLRGAAGALLALALTGAVSLWLLPGAAAWLIAPMGASAVLLFCLPASPLAQPWSIIGGNTVSAIVGVACAQSGLDLMLAAPLAGGGAIAAMFALRCLHPPGGAVALTAVLAGPAVVALGYRFPFAPVALNCILMVAGALVWNNLTGRRYPHRQQAPAPSAEGARLGFQSADLDAVLARYGQVLDVSRDDLEDIILATETQAYGRRFGVITCGAVMAAGLPVLEFATELGDAWRQMRQHPGAALPVLNKARRVIGLVSQTDFLRQLDGAAYPGMGRRLRQLLTRTPTTHTDKVEVVGQIMLTHVPTVAAATPIVELVDLMARGTLQHMAVVDEEKRYLGMISQSDVLAALYQSRIAELAAA